jgi:hypothetical protein
LAYSAMAFSEARLDASAAISGRFDSPPMRSRTLGEFAGVSPGHRPFDVAGRAISAEQMFGHQSAGTQSPRVRKHEAVVEPALGRAAEEAGHSMLEHASRGDSNVEFGDPIVSSYKRSFASPPEPSDVIRSAGRREKGSLG